MPCHVLFISGWFIEKINDGHTDKGYFGIKLEPPQDCSAETKKLYAGSEQEADEWVCKLQTSASTVSIGGHYSIGRVLGKGHFSVVHEGVHLRTGKKFAIKIVEKKRIDAREKEALRTEIAIMKIVKHPYIINMQDVYEDKRCIYMVMTLVEHGDFFERWSKRKLFAEDTAKIIIWKLLDAISYLHSLGIVHRDLKPENILCTSADDDTNIVISDFGLSKFAAPHEEMMMPCGTLAYVAPEVVSMKGYDRKVDLWSLGCIMHLLLRGVLPFDGHTKEEVIERTLRKPLNLTSQHWNKISELGKDLLKKLLTKDSENRIDVHEAINHIWFDDIRNQLKYHKYNTPALKREESQEDLQKIS